MPEHEKAHSRARRKVSETMTLMARHGPPWYIRVIGGAIMLIGAYVYLRENSDPTHVENWLELVGHGLFGLLGLSMAYPEGARQMMGFLRRTMPGMDRRGGPR